MISVVVPLYNEEESLHHFYKELKKEIEKLRLNYEIIFIDDGSTDRSLDLLKNLAKKDKSIRIFSFRRNRGKADALNTGFLMAKGDQIVTLDADLEDQPSEIKNLLKKLKEGYDMVSGWRKNRKHAWHMILPSKIFNYLSNLLWKVKLHDYNCGLKVYTKEAAKSLNLYGGLYRFIPLLLYQKGFKVTEIPVSHSKRKYGKSKFGFSKVWKDLPDMFTVLFLTKYDKRPLHFFGIAGSFLIILGVLVLAYLSIVHFQGYAIGRRPLLFFGMLLVLAGFQIFFTGLIADLITNTYYKSNGNKEHGLKYSSEEVI